MPLTAADLAYVRSEIGSASPPSDSDLNTAYDALPAPNPAVVALQVLGARYADMLSKAVSFEVPDQLKADFSKNLDVLEKQIARLRMTTGVGSPAPIVWAGGVDTSDQTNRDPSVVAPYFFEDMDSFRGSGVSDRSAWDRLGR